MLVLHTKDGSRVGNAIIYGGDVRYFEAKPGPLHIFLVETDFGNKMRLTWNEINELFTISHVEDYQLWKQERLNKQENGFDEFRTEGLPQHGTCCR